MTQKGGYSSVVLAIPISMLKSIFSQIKTLIKMIKSWLGISLTNCQPDVILSLANPNIIEVQKY